MLDSTPRGLISFSLVILMSTSVGSAQEPGWQCLVEEAAFSRRDTAEDAVFLGRMWLSNAYTTGGDLARDLWSSEDGVNWTLVLEETPYDGYSEMAVFHDKLWAVKASVWNTEDGVNWTRVLEETSFGSRGYGELVVFEDKLWQLGSGEDVWCSTDGVDWTCVLDKAPFGNRYGSAVAVYDGKLWLCGGAVNRESDPPEKHYKQYTTHNDVWCSEDGKSWRCVLEHAPWAQRQWFVAREYAGRLWIFGGFSNRESRNFSECWTTEDGVNWEPFISGQMWSARHEPTIYVYGKSLYLAAGNMWPLMNDVWKLTMER